MLVHLSLQGHYGFTRCFLVWPDILCLSAGVNLRPQHSQVEPLPVCEETSNELRTRERAQPSRFFMRRPTRAALGPQSHITIYRLFVS